MSGIYLTGLDGTNPAAYLAALGVLRVLNVAWPDANVRLAWPKGGVHPVPQLLCDGPLDPTRVCATLYERLREEKDGADTKGAEVLRKAAYAVDRELSKQSKAVKKEAEALGLKGRVKEAYLDRKLIPLRMERDALKESWIVTQTSGGRYFRLGDRLEAPDATFRKLAWEAVAGGDGGDAAFFASLGAESGGSLCLTTPFCFINGSGGQEFLRTWRTLRRVTAPDHYQKALFTPWEYGDTANTFRWDPNGWRTHALRAEAPGDSKPPTMWGAERLAVEALPFFPVSVLYGKAACPGWSEMERDLCFTWPIWEGVLGIPAVRTLVTHPVLAEKKPELRTLRLLGVYDAYRSVRCRDGKQTTFGPGRPV